MFYVVHDCYKKGIPIDSNIIQGKARSCSDILKQKEGEESKAGEFNASKGWFDNFRKRFGFQNIKITREAASADRVASDRFPDTIKKTTDEKGYLPVQVFNADESALFWKKKKKCHEGHLLVRKRSKHQDLRLEGIG